MPYTHCSFCKNLYTDENIEELEDIKKKLVLGVRIPGIYLITSAQGSHEKLAIQKSSNITNKYFSENPVKVYVVCSSVSSAMDMLVKISDEAIKAGYTGKIKEYLDSEESAVGN